MKTAIICFIALLSFCLAGRAFEVDLSKDDAKRLFDEAAAPIPVISDGSILIPSLMETHALRVDGGKKYLLEIRARVDGSFVTEENDRAHLFTLQSHQNRLSSTYAVTFLNAAGGEIPAPGKEAPRGFFLSKESQPYTQVFYAPPEATSLKIRFQSNGRTTRISALRLVEETAEQTINPNPDFRYGELSYCGWSPKRDGRLYTRPDGETVLNTGHLGASPYFPLEGGKRYRFSAKGKGAHLNAHYYDKEGKSIASRFILRPAVEGAEAEAVPPEGTAMARVVASGVVFLEELKVVKIE